MTQNTSTHSISVLRNELIQKQVRRQGVQQDREKRKEEYQKVDKEYQGELDLIEQEIEGVLESIKILQLESKINTADRKRSEPGTPTTSKFNKGDRVVITSPTGNLKGIVATVQKETRCQVELKVPGKKVTVYRAKRSVEPFYEK